MSDLVDGYPEDMRGEIDKLRAEIERLRAALKEIKDETWPSMRVHEIASHALDPNLIAKLD